VIDSRLKVGGHTIPYHANATSFRPGKEHPLVKAKSNSCFDNKYNIITLSDFHIPFHDVEAIQAALNFCRKIQPQILIIHEMHDFYSLSRFDKDPDRITGLQTELNWVGDYFRMIRDTCPDSRIILLNSNHLDRLRKYLWSHAQALSSLDALAITELLDLKRYDIEYMDNFVYNNFIFKHGNLVSKEAGMTARRELAAEGLSGVSGHTHRAAVIYSRHRNGRRVWIENGCLCSLSPEYMEGRIPDWQHGISIVSFDTLRETVFATVLPIENGEFLFGKF
jgi:hypothetical protein